MFFVNVKNKVKYSLVCTNCVMIIDYAPWQRVFCFIAKFENSLVPFARWRSDQRHRYRRRRSGVRLPGRSSRALSPMRFLYSPGDNPRKCVPPLVTLFSVALHCSSAYVALFSVTRCTLFSITFSAVQCIYFCLDRRNNKEK